MLAICSDQRGHEDQRKEHSAQVCISKSNDGDDQIVLNRLWVESTMVRFVKFTSVNIRGRCSTENR